MADFILRDLIGRHGRFETLHSDNGTHFKGDVTTLLSTFGIHHTFSIPERPQGSGLVERFQRTLIGSLQKCADKNPHNWDRYLPIALLDCRASIQSSTKFSSFFLLYGREADLRAEDGFSFVEHDLPPSGYEQILIDHVTQRAQELGVIFEKVKDNVSRAQVAQKRGYDMRRNLIQIWKPKKGEYVLLKPPEKRTRELRNMEAYKQLYRVERVTPFGVLVAGRNGTQWFESFHRIQAYQSEGKYAMENIYYAGTAGDTGNENVEAEGIKDTGTICDEIEAEVAMGVEKGGVECSHPYSLQE